MFFCGSHFLWPKRGLGSRSAGADAQKREVKVGEHVGLKSFLKARQYVEQAIPSSFWDLCKQNPDDGDCLVGA